MGGLSAGPRILVKARPGLSESALALGETRIRFSAEPLFHSIGAGARQGAAPASVWQVLTADSETGLSPWDLCHALLTQDLGVAGGVRAEFAEPDLAQRWIIGDEKSVGQRLVAGCGEAAPQNPQYPGDPDPYWIRAAAHSGFAEALVRAGAPTAANKVRIAHFDTGYDPHHKSLPRFFNTPLQKNFVDPGRPADASDDSAGPLTNPGHGTGTLGILAGSAIGGAPLGCAPNADVVPVRVSNSVVLFYNSAVARAFDYIHGLNANPATRVDIITMSMGGLASQAWAEAVNALYEQGVFIVTAAGNNYFDLPTRHIVYPARFNRVVAACGVMANHSPYADLAPSLMAGNYGPDDKMMTAISAYTPNTPWARMGCPSQIDFDGSGTSSATPQVAAAASLWIQANRAAVNAYPEGWMRVEAIRTALFESAKANAQETRRLGRGELKARAALDVAPAKAAALKKQSADTARFPFLDTLTGGDFGVASAAQRRMMELEALQLSQSAAVEAALPDPSVAPEALSARDKVALADALLAQPGISAALRSALEGAGRAAPPARRQPQRSSAVEEFNLKTAKTPPVAPPLRRRLRTFAFDPSLATDPSVALINEAVLDLRWEDDLRPGPIGEYVEVVDVDPASRCAYAPVDLNHPYLLPQDGLAPSEGNPQFHQQMAYAVAMRTIESFEEALGRTALWSPRWVHDANGGGRAEYVQRLRIYPHALRAANAFYSPDRKALLLGYFSATEDSAGLGLPHGMYFGALSHDVVAHETTHALLDGLHRRFREPTNPDVLAFHEAFADIVALFQHFAVPEALRNQIRRTRGDLSAENILGKLAVEFGQAMRGNYGALRDAIGQTNPETNKWEPATPKRTDYDPSKEPHELGSVLVSAVFSAFLTIYKTRTLEFVRLASGGTGVLPPGDIPTALADRMAEEASLVAAQISRICIRALDYCPPVDITFGEYLRALITADRDLVPNDPLGYRVAFVAAFRDRGIYPPDVKHLSPGNLVWEPPPLPLEKLAAVLPSLELTWGLDFGRRKAYDTMRTNARILHKWLMEPAQAPDAEIDALGLVRNAGPATVGAMSGVLDGIEVHSVRPARRIGPDGQSQIDLVVEITQTFRPSPLQGGPYRGGCTLLIDLHRSEVRYCIRKRLAAPGRIEAQQSFRLALADTLRNAYFDAPPGGREPFAILHGRH